MRDIFKHVSITEMKR